MKNSLFVLREEAARTLRQSKILLILFFIIMLYETVLSPIKGACAETGYSLQVFEPFILLCTNSTNIILVPLVYVVLLGDFPYCKTMYFQIIRTGKKQWLLGEIAFIVLSSFALMFVIFFTCDLLLLKNLNFYNDWSDFMTITWTEYPMTYAKNVLLFLDPASVAHGGPIRVMIYTFGMLWLYLIMSGVCVLFGTIIGKRFAAMMVSVASTVIGGMAIFFGSWIKWVFPLAHVEYGLHYNILFSEEYFPVIASVIYLGLLTVGLAVLCRLMLKRMRIGDEL